jgi:hypothetical protein
LITQKEEKMRRLKRGSTNIRRRLFAVVIVVVLAVSSICFGYSGGSGTPEEPYGIATKADLLELAGTTTDYNKCFILTTDINMGGQVFTMAIIAADTSTGGGFQGTDFSGTFDGNSHKITNFTINGGSNDYLGLFGKIDSNGSVKNLGSENCTISGIFDSHYIGSLAGYNNGNIINCHSTGTVSGGNNAVGGLAGYSHGSIIDCYSTGMVSGGYQDVGGLVGWNYRGNISRCNSTGTVSGGNNTVGGLVGSNDGSISDCYSTGTVSGDSSSSHVGGLVGDIGYTGSISNCYSTGMVSGYLHVGGLVGSNSSGSIINCYSRSTVSGYSGSWSFGGLVGYNGGGSIINCYSMGAVNGGSNSYVGGMVGGNDNGSIINCYSRSTVSGNGGVGGLVGGNNIFSSIINCYSTGAVSGSYVNVGGLVGQSSSGSSVSNSFWDKETSGLATSSGGMGKTTVEMKMMSTFTDAGWDFVGEVINGPNDIWKICEGESYPQLWYEKYGGGMGDANNPYLIYTSCQMNEIGADANDWDKHFKLMADINLIDYNESNFKTIGNSTTAFTGGFDGNGNQISNFTYDSSEENVGLFGVLDGEIKNLGIIDPNVRAEEHVGSLVGLTEGGTISGCYVQGGFVRGTWQVGGLIGINNDMASIVNCHSIGNVSGNYDAGGLIAINRGTVVRCYAIGNVSGVLWVGGLVGGNDNEGTLIECYSLGSILGSALVGGLAGKNNMYYGKIINCYSRSTVDGSFGKVGGLVGENLGEIINSHSTGSVTSNGMEGGLVGNDFWSDMGQSWRGMTVDSFWDTEASGQSSSAGGTGKTTAQMKTKSTFTSAGWDFVGEVINGPNDIWKICEGTNYPKLSWQIPLLGDFVCPDGVEMNDLAELCEEWLLKELSSDVWPEGGDGIVNFFDWAELANEWQVSIDFEALADFAKQWLKTGARYCIADIAPAEGGDGIVNMPDFAVLANNWLARN